MPAPSPPGGFSLIPAPAGFISPTSPGTAGPITGFNSVLASITGGVISSFPSPPQQYFSVPFPNNLPALYRLTFIDNAGQRLDFTFPLSPENVTKRRQGLSASYDVRGTPNLNGVQRIIDQYGLTLPFIDISGTTGFQFHSADGFRYSGRRAQAVLISLLNEYARLSAASTQSNGQTPMPSIEFSDGFTQEVFEVIPIGAQVDSMESRRPILRSYSLEFVAVSDKSAPPPPEFDGISNVFLQLREVTTAGFLTFWNDTLNSLLTSVGIQ